MDGLIKYRLILAVSAAMALSASISAQDKNHSSDATSVGKTSVVVEGLVRDLACPIQNHKSTATNFNLECALACAKSGSPLIILTKAGDIYFPISDQMPDPDQRGKLMPFVGKYVRVNGTVFQRNGTRTIVIQKIDELTAVKLQTKLGGD